MSTELEQSVQKIAIEIPEQQLRDFCRRNHIQELALFGSVIGDNFGPDSDIDVLVEFEPDAAIDLFEFSGMRLELLELFGREVDLATPAALKPLIKDKILASKVIIYAV